jgi:PTS system mannitol-specific IIC component
VSGVFVLTIFDAGLVSVASPGSIISILLMTATDSYLGVILSILIATAVSFIISAIILKVDRKGDLDDIEKASEKMQAIKGKKSSVASAFTGNSNKEKETLVSGYEGVKSIIFACDAGLGSIAMGASLIETN